MRKTKKNLVLMILLIFAVVFGAIFSYQGFAATTVDYQGKISIPKATTGVGKFTINGDRAFCLQHAKLSPADGAKVIETEDLDDSVNIRKVLYYGWAGPEQWSGFDGKKDKGIMITSLVLSSYYGDLGGNYSYLDGYDEFKNYVKKQPLVKTKKALFSKGTLKATWDPDKGYQYTPTISIKGTDGESVTFTVPKNVTLVVVGGKTYTNQKVTLKVGTKFYFKATYNPTKAKFDTGKVGKNYKYTPRVYKVSGNKQDLGKLITTNETTTGSSLVVTWDDLGKLTLKKTNSNGASIAGAKFRVKGTNYDETFTVPVDGITITLPTGKYTITEVSVPTGYLDRDYSKTVTITKNENFSITIKNTEPTGTLKLTKTLDLKASKRGDITVEGAEYTLYAKEKITNKKGDITYYTKDQKVDVGTTDKNGKFTITGLPLGKYYLKETKAPKGCFLDKTVHNVTFEYKNSKTKEIVVDLEVVDEIVEVAVDVEKVETGKTVGLKGAKFLVKLRDDVNAAKAAGYTEAEIWEGYNEDAEKVTVNADRAKKANEIAPTYDTLTTGDNGHAVSDPLPYGVYMFKEIKAPDGYIPGDATTVRATDSDGEMDVTIPNDSGGGRLKLVKLNTTNNGIGGAKFRVVGNGYDKTHTVPAEGLTLKLDNGTYTVTEVGTPDGYLVNVKDTYTVVINTNKTTTLSITNNEPTGTLNVIKKYKDPDGDHGESTLEGAEYTLYAKEDIYNKNKDKKYYSKDKKVKVGTTDKNGKFTMTGLPLGKYYLKETKASEGCELDPTIYNIEFVYKDKDTKVININQTVYEDVVKCAADIFKVETGKTIGLPGAEFAIKNANHIQKAVNAGYTYEEIWNGIDKNGNKVNVDATRVAKANEIAPTYDTIVTGEDGHAVSKKLPYGNYKIKETKAPTNYVTGEDVDLCVSMETPTNASGSIAMTIKNDHATGKLILNKLNSTGKNIEGAIFNIKGDDYDEDHLVPVEGLTLTLPVGQYTITEIGTPTGYLVNVNSSQVATIKENKTTTINITNYEPTGTLNVTKIYNKGDSLKGDSTLIGAEYTLYAKEDILNRNGDKKYYSKDEVVKVANIGNDHSFTIKDLPLGKYYLKETKAPEGCLIDPTVYDATIDCDIAEVSNLTDPVIIEERDVYEDMVEYKIDIFKVGTENKSKGLPGAEFVIKLNSDIDKALEAGYTYEEIWNGLDKDGKKVTVDTERVKNANEIAPTYATLVTDETGHAVSELLPYGQYTIKETKAPAKHYLSTDLTVNVSETTSKDDNGNIAITVENEPIVGKLELHKLNSTNKNIDGATFNVKGEGYNKDHKVPVEGLTLTLPIGEYTVTEVGVPNGYLVNVTNNKVATIEENKTTTVKFVNNEPTGTLNVTKVYADPDKHKGESTIVGAEYTLYAKEDIFNKNGDVKHYSKDEVVKVGVTDKNAKFTMDKLPMGKYYLKETKASKGCQLDTTVYDVEFVYKDKDTEVITLNKQVKEAVIEYKVDIFKVGTENLEEAVGLPGAEYVIKFKTDIDKALEAGYTYEEIWNGIDKDGNKVDVDAERVTQANEIAPTYDTLVTGEDGHAVSKSLSYGEYVVKEVKVPVDFYFGKDFNFKVDNETPKDKNGNIPLSQYNKQMEAFIRLIKMDEDTGKIVSLTSATFQIKANEDIIDRGTGKVIYEKDTIVSKTIDGVEYKEFTTNAEGDVGVETDSLGKVVTPISLPVGKYVAEEIKTPDGFILPEAPIDFNIENIISYEKQGDMFIKPVEIKNKQVFGTLTINKVITNPENDFSFIDNVDVTDIEFTLYAKENIIDKADGEVKFEKDQEVAKGNLNEDSIITFDNLYLGEYYFKETSVIPEFMPNEKVYDVSIKQSDFTTAVVEETVDVVNELTTTEFKKTDAVTSEEVPGATLEIIDPETEETIVKFVSTEEPYIVTGLIYGKEYILKETINPKTYELNTQEVKFVAGTDQKVEMKDEPIKISGDIDKRQTYFDKNNKFAYTIDYRSTSTTWADEFNMKDTIDCAVKGYAKLTSIKTPVVSNDYDGKMNVWYKTNKTPEDYTEDADNYNACSTNPENPWNTENKRVESYEGWKLWKSDVSTLKSITLKVSNLKLDEDEYITDIAFEHGRVEKGFTTRTSDWKRKDLKSEDDTLKSVITKHEDTFDVVTEIENVEEVTPPTEDVVDVETEIDVNINDTEEKVEGIEEETPEPEVKTETYNYEPAVLYMAVNKDSDYKGKLFENDAKITIYRNLGDHKDLEDFDEDKVVQKYPKPNPKPEPQKNESKVQTGDETNLLPWVIAFTVSAIGLVGVVVIIRRRY